MNVLHSECADLGTRDFLPVLRIMPNRKFGGLFWLVDFNQISPPVPPSIQEKQ